MPITDVLDIKLNNAKCILNAVRSQGVLTKKDIAEITSLSFATVSNLCNELKNKDILIDTKLDIKRVGRIPNTLQLNNLQFRIISLDFQLENSLGFSLLDLNNHILFQNIYDISHLSCVEDIVAFAANVYQAHNADFPEENSTLIGIGAAVPAVFDSNTERLVLSSVPIYENAPLKQMLATAFNAPAYVDNIANTRALSAYIRNKQVREIVCLDVSQGVGIGVITDGSLLRGRNGYASEVAHIPIGSMSRRCPLCGGYGCIETELSLHGMVKMMPSINQDLPLMERWNAFVVAMAEATPETIAIAQRIGSLMGQLATILINLFDPEHFYITGYVCQIFPQCKPYFFKELELRCSMTLAQDLQILCLPAIPPTDEVYTGLSDAIYNLWNPLAP